MEHGAACSAKPSWIFICEMSRYCCEQWQLQRTPRVIAHQWCSFSIVSRKVLSHFDSPTVLEISETVSWFFDACSDLGSQAFLSRQGRFTVPLFEATFASACQGRPTLGSDWRLTDNIVTETPD